MFLQDISAGPTDFTAETAEGAEQINKEKTVVCFGGLGGSLMAFDSAACRSHLRQLRDVRIRIVPDLENLAIIFPAVRSMT